MAKADCLPESHQSGSPQTHLLEEGSGASQPITTVSSMNLHVYGIQWLHVHMHMYMYTHYKWYWDINSTYMYTWWCRQWSVAKPSYMYLCSAKIFFGGIILHQCSKGCHIRCAIINTGQNMRKFTPMRASGEIGNNFLRLKITSGIHLTYNAYPSLLWFTKTKLMSMSCIFITHLTSG